MDEINLSNQIKEETKGSIKAEANSDEFKSFNQIQEEKKERNSMKIVINLFDKVEKEEQNFKKEVNIEQTLIKFIDEFLKNRKELTDEQKQILAKVRSRIIIEFIGF